MTRLLRYGGNTSARAAGGRRGAGRRTSRRRVSGSGVAAETLEKRILPAVTLTIDYSLDSSGFFNVQARRDAIQAVANEIGARLNDDLGAVAARTTTVTNPSSYSGGRFTATASRIFSLAANELRIFVGGAGMSGGMVGIGGWRSNSGIRGFDTNHEFEPYVGHIAFDNDGSTRWSYDDSPASGETNFRLVARHELLHVLGLGGSTSWDVRIAGGAFTGANARAANGGVNPLVDPYGGHFATGVNSIMAPAVGSILHPTAIDWAALDDIGWTVAPSEPPPPLTPVPIGLVAAPGAGYEPLVKVYDASGSVVRLQFYAYDPSFRGGVRVAVGDVNGDGMADVITAPAAGAQQVQVFDGLTGAGLRSFFAFPENPSFGGGITLAVADVNRDDHADIILSVAGGAGPAVRVVDGRTGTQLSRFWAFIENPFFGGGVNLAAADVDGDGSAEVIATIAGGAGPAVRVLEPLSGGIVSKFWAFIENPTFGGGVNVAAGDIDGDGRAEVVAAIAGGAGPVIRVLEPLSGRIVSNFWAFPENTSFLGGVSVGVTDVDRDGRAEILAVPARGAQATVRLLDPFTGRLLGAAQAYPAGFTGGAFLAGETFPAPAAVQAVALPLTEAEPEVPTRPEDRWEEETAPPPAARPAAIEDLDGLFAAGLDEELLAA